MKDLATQGGENRRPLSGAHANIQSHDFTISRTVNPLVAAAAPLLARAADLAKTHLSLPLLLTELKHEICAFESKAQSLGYRAQVVLAARYLLCTLLDELVCAQYKEATVTHGLLAYFQDEVDGSERVFYILVRAGEDPAIYIELLELGYLCLNLGLQGKYRHLDNGHIDLHNFTDELYHIIRHQQGQATKILSIGQLPQQTQSKIKKQWRLPPIWATVGSVCAILVILYIPYRIHLTNLVTHTHAALVHLTQAHHA